MDSAASLMLSGRPGHLQWDKWGTICAIIWHEVASLVAEMVKNLPTTQETWVQSLGQKAPLEKDLATHSSILAWRVPCTEKPAGLQPMGL